MNDEIFNKAWNSLSPEQQEGLKKIAEEKESTKKTNDFEMAFNELKTANEDDRYMSLPDGSSIEFNGEQYEGIGKIRNWLKSDQTFFSLAGYAGTGKAQPLDCKVVTPNGYVRIGDVNVNDYVIGVDGKPVRVVGVYPQGVKQAYNVGFRDETFTECNVDHLWNVWTKKLRQNKRPTKTMTLREIMDSGLTRGVTKKQYNYSIPLCEPVQFDEKKLPIHPYLLGVLIGEYGYLCGSSISLSNPDIDSEIIDIIEDLIPSYIEIRRFETTCPTYRLVDVDSNKSNKLKGIIKSLNLNVKSVDKHIPVVYKYSSIEQRWELLRGLMDTDGTSRGNRIGFSTSSSKLRDDVIELVQSLGCVAIRNKDDVRSENTNYSINIKTNENPFKINRKNKNWVFSEKNSPSRYITSIEKSRVCDQVCISVDSENGLYLTDNYIVTHNSTIIKKIIDEYRGKLCVSAPTHKAKKVIMRTTGEDGETLHSLLGLRPDVNLDDFNPNDPKFNPIASAKIHIYNLVIIDEASMINGDLFELIKTEVKFWGNIKVLFMGDHAQIPPIGESESVVFSSNIGELHQLTKVMRQKDGNPLFLIYDALRNNLEYDDGGIKDKTTKLNSNNEGIVYTKSKKTFRERLVREFNSKEFRISIDHAKIIAWRNSTVMESNKLVRRFIYGKEARMLEVSDVLMAYRSIRGGGRKRGNILDNSGDYQIENVSKLMSNKFDLRGYTVKISEILGDGKKAVKSIFIVDHEDHDNLHNYAEIHDALILIAKADRNQWKKYYEFRKNSLIMVKIEQYRDGRTRFYESIIAKDLDYGYAITGHKSQGSTYKHVFVLEYDINLNPKTKEMNQIKYVALTRPSTSATVLTEVD